MLLVFTAVCLISAALCALLAALGVPAGRVNLIGGALFFIALAMLAPVLTAVTPD